MVNPGYSRVLRRRSRYWFTDRDAFHTDDITRTDIALNYSITFGKRFEIFIQPEVLNVFDEDGVINVNTAVLVTGPNCPDGAEWSTARRFNPFTHHSRRGRELGQGRRTSASRPTPTDFQTPRTFRVSVGFRF